MSNPFWTSLGARPGSLDGRAVVLDFGDPEREARSALQHLGIGPRPDLLRVELRGADRLRFLHGQCTQEVKSRRPGEGGYAFVLDPKGRVVSDLDFVVLEDAIEILAPAARREALVAWLGRFVLASGVVIAEGAPDEVVLEMVGPTVDTTLAKLGLPTPSSAEGSGARGSFGGESVLLLRGAPRGTASVLLVLRAPAVPSLVGDVLGAAPAEGPVTLLGAAAFELLRLAAGIPRFGADLDEQVLPVESGQIARAVSFTKGCYCGQEVVARQHFLGKPRKRLCRLVIRDEGAACGDAIVLGDEVLGQLTTVGPSLTEAASLGLAVLRGHDHPPGRVVRLRPATGGPEVPAVIEGPMPPGSVTLTSP